MTHAWKWYGAGQTDIGCERENNEDQLFIDNHFGVFIVADGMGGVDGGEIASQIIVDELPQLIEDSYNKFHDLSNLKFITLLQEDICAVNDLIFREGKNRGFRGIGSTLVLAMIKDQKMLVAHVGDSRCYRFRNNSLECLTQDHASPGRPNELTRAVGLEEVLHSEVQIHKLKSDDQVILCSDGLNHMLSNSQIQQLMKESDQDQIAPTLISAAKQAGGEDNITVIHISNA